MGYGSSIANVSAFCRAVLRNIIPHDFWGTGDVQAHNEGTFHKNVDKFIGLRRFEALSLHEVIQGIKVNGVYHDWI